MQTSANQSDMIKAGKQIDNPNTALCRITMPHPGIEVWQARLDLNYTDVMQCAKLLSRDEQLRADRFYFERDRRRFMVARGKLRLLLSRHCQIAPASIVFAYMKNGKPYVPGNATQIQFNLSHSEERALYAISRSCCLGVDIEYLNRDIDWPSLARRFFSHSESTALEGLPVIVRKRAFFTCWTRKEAIIKATGDGLALPLDQFEVTIEPDAEPRLISSATLRIADWTLYATDVGNDYVSTIAANRGN